jgi:hypothetical protein
MGLDQYIYRTTKKRWKAHLEFEKVCKEYDSLVEKLSSEKKWNDFTISLPKKENGGYDWDKFTDEQKKGISRYKRECRKIAKGLDMKLDDQLGPKFEDKKYGLNSRDDLVEEVMYWRKEWGLHKYIVDNFWKDKENDNLVNIPLRRKDIKKMIADRVEPDTFKAILKMLDKDHVVWYWPWY